MKRQMERIRLWLKRLPAPLLGFFALMWFLIRVIPKPSRAGYPCQRAAFPLASAFVLWLVSMAGSGKLFLIARTQYRQSRYLLATGLFMVSAILLMTLASPFETGYVNAAAFKLRATLQGSQAETLVDRSEREDSIAQPLAIVGAVKSPQAQAADIDFDEVVSMVNTAIDRAGGLESIVNDGDTVVLKPNLIASQDFTFFERPLPPEANGIATDHRVIQAVVNAVRAVNPNGAIILLEGSGVGTTSENMSNLLWDQVTGLDSIMYLESSCGAWFDTTSAHLQGVSLPADTYLYDDYSGRYWLNRIYYDADVLISLPVLKNHFNAGITGAVKNVGIGATPPTIYGFGPNHPYLYERWGRIDHGPDNSWRVALHDWIHDYYMCRPVDFVIMEGIQGIENGPLCHAFLNGSQSLADDQMNMRLMLASSDPIAIDAVSGLLSGQDPQLVRHLTTLHNDSMGICDPRLLRVDGIKVGDEKQLFEIANSGALSQYTDFTPPLLAVNQALIVEEGLYLELSLDEEVTKVEVAIDGVYCDEIRLAGFDSFTISPDPVVLSEGQQIEIFAYDEYLNYSSEVVSAVVSLDEDVIGHQPANFTLHPAYPNPFNPSTTIQFDLEAPATVRVEIYDATGKYVTTLQDSQLDAGSHTITWFASDEDGHPVSSGVYHCRVLAGEFSQSIKMVFLE